MMQKVVCINDNTLSGVLKGGKVYCIDLSSLYGDYEGDWYADVYTEKREKYLGHLLLKHFKSLI